MLLCHQKGVKYHLKVFRHYYRLIPVVGGGTRIGGGYNGIQYFTFRAHHASYDALITSLRDNVNGQKST